MKFLFLTLFFILLSGCETVDSMQQDLTELSNSVFSSSEEQPAAEDAFFKALMKPIKLSNAKPL